MPQHHMPGGSHSMVLHTLGGGEALSLRQITFSCAPLSVDTVRGTLTELMHEGRVERVTRGVYRLRED